MSYLVIARKWRPGVFEEMVGQEHVVRTLKNAVSSGRIAHAYLFSGPRGVGKTTCARILAKSLNCTKGPTPTPCNTCEVCQSITAGSSVDVFEIDGASNTGVDNVRELRENIMYMPSQGRYRVYIIDEVHMLSVPAFNALLKTLEEPPSHVIFIFATTEPHKIPSTILSRCQRFDFRRLSVREIYDHLKKISANEGISIEDDALFSIVREADGSLRDAQSLMDQVIAFAGTDIKYSHVVDALGLMDRAILFELVDAVIEGDGKRCLNIVEKVHNFGYDLKKVCTELLEYIRNLTVLRVAGGTDLFDLPEGELGYLKGRAEKVSVERLQALYSVISRAYEEVTRAVFPRYSLEMALLRAVHLEEFRSISDLIKDIKTLKEGVGKERVEEKDREGDRRKGRAREGGTRDEGEREGEDNTPLDRDTSGGDGLAGYITKRDRLFSRPFENAGIVVRDGTVDITVNSRDFGFLQIKKDYIEGMCREYLGRPVKVNIRSKGGGVPHSERRKDMDPLLREAMRILDGRIIEDRRRKDV